MADQPDADLTALVATSGRVLHGIRTRSQTARIASEVARLNGAVRDLARTEIGWSDQPGDFTAALLRNADPTNG
jgi:hypothetical protein